ncbi:hypothetical protein D9611_000254 [Ephemerocybe angulata]|uniref:Zinc finger PHD-type domain-containing protein n=1 Tax=Ephemerocybe angulata TaxID=980116 RepID=A0A8H5F805_9AGAR|nr:hypothetical protein D9611_000254 [Tulosesus angulatus]
MAQNSAMGPPQSPKEIRRSGRRQGPSGSTSNSKSPDSDQPPKSKDTASRPALATNASSSRSKRLKQEELEDADEERKTNPAPSVTSNGSTHGTAPNGKAKRKGREKDKQTLEEEQLEEDGGPAPEDGELAGGDDEAEGITRCVCGSTGRPLLLPPSPSVHQGHVEDDPDAGEFMVQCEGCKVWQHGPCMGYMTEDQVEDEDYFCEQCRPEQHVDLLKRLAANKKGRHAHSSGASRVSRSRSPSQLKQQSKRRNTMNRNNGGYSSRGRREGFRIRQGRALGTHDADNDDGQANVKKKRKRIEDELPSKKRTRSASTASERQGSALPRDDTPVSASTKPVSQAPAAAKGTARNKRGGRKTTVPDSAPPVEGEVEATSSSTTVIPLNKRQASNKGKSTAVKRPPLSTAISHNGSGANQEHTASRARNPAGVNQHTAANADARAYRNSHAYAVSQQPLFTSWGLPDYLSHLEPMLPTEFPQPLEVRSTSNSAPGTRGESSELTMERGVKVKWPGKRMSVGDMNKRVRALVEWVGREQANALDRERRKEALSRKLNGTPPPQPPPGTTDNDGDVVMGVDAPSSSRPEESSIPTESVATSSTPREKESSTMRLMEELMEELISFQERFGPGAKAREREQRRQGAASYS